MSGEETAADLLRRAIGAAENAGKQASSAAEATKGLSTAFAGLTAELKRIDPAGQRQAAAEVGAAARSIREVAQLLNQTLPAAQEAAGRSKRVTWLVRAILALLAVLGLLSAFAGGIIWTRSGQVLTNEVGCRWMGGTWLIQNGQAVCYKWGPEVGAIEPPIQPSWQPR